MIVQVEVEAVARHVVVMIIVIYIIYLCAMNDIIVFIYILLYFFFFIIMVFFFFGYEAVIDFLIMPSIVNTAPASRAIPSGLVRFGVRVLAMSNRAEERLRSHRRKQNMKTLIDEMHLHINDIEEDELTQHKKREKKLMATLEHNEKYKYEKA